MGRNRKTGILNLLANIKGTNAETYKANVLQYIQGTSTRERDFKNDPVPAGRSLLEVGIVPFWSLPSDAGNTITPAMNVYVSMTQQAGQICELMPTVGGKDIYETAGIEIDLEKVTGTKPTGFYPAIARISITDKSGGATTYIDASKISSITGRTYKLPKRRSGTIPFGRSLGATQKTTAGGNVLIADPKLADYGEVSSAIKAITKQYATTNEATKSCSVSFENEVIRQLQKRGSKALVRANLGTLAP